MKVFL